MKNHWYTHLSHLTGIGGHTLSTQVGLGEGGQPNACKGGGWSKKAEKLCAYLMYGPIGMCYV